jgi:microcystin-dependent protein
MKKIITYVAAAACLFGAGSADVKADSDPFIGTIMQVGENFCPRGWAVANGALLPIAQNTALFSLLGTAYGGDGRTTFGLPDLQGRFSVGVGRGPGLTPRTQGEKSGNSTAQYSLSNLATHTHGLAGSLSGTVGASSNAPSQSSPLDAYKATFPAGVNGYASGGTANIPMGAASVTFTNNIVLSTEGQSTPFNNMQPYQALTTCIALQGIYPSRS